MKVKFYRSNRLLDEKDLNLLAAYVIPVKRCGWSLYQCRICGCRFHSRNDVLSHLKGFHRLRGEYV